jgi:hypothetical protein
MKTYFVRSILNNRYENEISSHERRQYEKAEIKISEIKIYEMRIFLNCKEN